MATVRIRKTNERIQGEEQVSAFLQEQGVLYEHWDTGKLADSLKEKFLLSDSDKEEILETYASEIKSLAERG